jgi:hypothetical protein
MTSPTQRKSGKRLWLWVVGIFAVLCIGGVVLGALNATPKKDKQETIVKSLPDQDKPTPDATIGGNGGVAVGRAVVLPPGDYDVARKYDLKRNRIRPGTYTIGADESGHCYWERVKSWSGEFDSIIANGNIDGQSKARVRVSPSDKGLHLDSGCIAAIKQD